VFSCAEVGEGVGAFVAGIAVMAFHPSPRDAVPSRGVVESAPQVAVLDRLLVRGRPAAFLPVVDPLGDALRTYSLSVNCSTSLGPFKAVSASITAVSSIRLFVVAGEPPVQLFAVRSAG
jgi:hypothetical protein